MSTTGALHQMRMLQLASANLPVGGFTYSQGLEWAVEAGWVRQETDFRSWLQMQIEDTLLHVDWPLLVRLHAACQARDLNRFTHWSHYLLACRETAELRTEERQRGEAFARMLRGWQLCTAGQGWPEWMPVLAMTQAGGMAWLAHHWGIPLETLLLAQGFGWLEGVVMAAVKLVPLGQQAAQSVLADTSPQLAEGLQCAQALSDDELGGGIPLVAIASACHETQYTRLFRS